MKMVEKLKLRRIELLTGSKKPDWGEYEYNIVYRAEELDFLYDDVEKRVEFEESLKNSDRDLYLGFEGEIFEEGTQATINEYFIDEYNEIADETKKNEIIDTLLSDTEEEINRILEEGEF